MGPAMSCVRCACGRGCHRASDCCPETTPPRWLSLPMAGMAAFPRYRMSRRNCVRPFFSNCRQGRLQSARYLQNRLTPLNAALSRESPAALKYALSMLGFIHPSTRLPIVELAEPAKAEVACAIAEIGDECLACPGKSGHGPRPRKDSANS